MTRLPRTDNPRVFDQSAPNQIITVDRDVATLLTAAPTTAA
jgi:hypothetical protein